MSDNLDENTTLKHLLEEFESFVDGCGMPEDAKCQMYLTRGVLSSYSSEKEIIFKRLIENKECPNNVKAEAHYFLGVNYLVHSDANKFDIKKAINQYEAAAKLNHIEAMIVLGEMLYEDVFCKPKLDKARYWLTRAFKACNSLEGDKALLTPKAYLAYSKFLLINDKEYLFSYAYLTAVASQNHTNYEGEQAEANYWLALINHDELVPSATRSNYIHLLRKAAEGGFLDAQIELAKHYYLGKQYPGAVTIPKNLRSAFKWYLAAAKQEDSDAQYEIGKYYKFGWGIETDREKALEWYVKAAEQEHVEALFEAGCGLLGTNPDQGVKYITRSAELNNGEAQYTLSELFREGEYVKKSIKKANYWYNRSQGF